jgi:hypothetical protein
MTTHQAAIVPTEVLSGKRNALRLSIEYQKQHGRMSGAVSSTLCQELYVL